MARDDYDDHVAAEALGGTSRSALTADVRHNALFGCGITHPGHIKDCWQCNNDLKPLPNGKIRVQVIQDTVAGTWRIEVDNPPTKEAERILGNTLPAVLELFLQKNKDYGDSDDMRSLGPRAEFVRIWNKVAKLKRSLWDGETLDYEDSTEIMRDMIGHLLLALSRSGS